jgi:hypothetical protein
MGRSHAWLCHILFFTLGIQEKGVLKGVGSYHYAKQWFVLSRTSAWLHSANRQQIADLVHSGVCWLAAVYKVIKFCFCRFAFKHCTMTSSGYFNKLSVLAISTVQYFLFKCWPGIHLNRHIT